MLRPEFIYEALTDEDALRQLPSRLATAAGARSAVLQFADSTGQADIFAYSYFSPALVADYLENFVHADVWANAAYASPRNQGRAVILTELVPDDIFARSVLWNEFFRSHRDDTYRCLGSAIPVPNGFGLIGIHRGKREPEFQPRDAAMLEAALPHMRRLFTVRSALLRAKAQAMVADAALDRLSTLALAIDRNGRVLAAHPENAEDLLRVAIGSGFRNGRIHFRHGLQAHWERLLERATLPATPAGGAMLLGLRTKSRVPVWLEISPAPGLPPPMCAIVIIRTAVVTPDLTRRRLHLLFGLTTAEADVAYLASQGSSADEIAATRSVAVTTVRAQIRGIFDKLECRSLSQLTMIVARLSG